MAGHDQNLRENGKCRRRLRHTATFPARRSDAIEHPLPICRMTPKVSRYSMKLSMGLPLLFLVYSRTKGTQKLMVCYAAGEAGRETPIFSTGALRISKKAVASYDYLCSHGRPRWETDIPVHNALFPSLAQCEGKIDVGRAPTSRAAREPHA
ncbi:hypothetical protein BD311DRAFT_749370 [Dichomitus squalens]|uniref:Uncharacterized protein n=1 Tax=Dichomitus squalens TaxID=114155 RepID=A0A4Q9MYH5_9APHY|nr:hypothetical protein BD311DRAFT_749370 [Dichomitus squalens]